MGTRGPAPKRSSQRRRVNKPETPIVKGTAGPRPRIPAADRSWHRIARGMYESLARSGQSQFFEASDWQQARLAAEATSRLLNADRLSAQLLAAVDAMWARLLMTEADRRRLRIELERPAADADAEAADADLNAQVIRLTG